MTTNHSHIFGRYKPRLHLTEVALHLCPVIYHRLLYVHIPRLRCPKFITSQKIASYLRAPTHLHCHQRALLQKPSADTLGSGYLTQTLDPPHTYTISQGKRWAELRSCLHRGAETPCSLQGKLFCLRCSGSVGHTPHRAQLIQHK